MKGIKNQWTRECFTRALLCSTVVGFYSVPVMAEWELNAESGDYVLSCENGQSLVLDSDLIYLLEDWLLTHVQCDPDLDSSQDNVSVEGLFSTLDESFVHPDEHTPGLTLIADPMHLSRTEQEVEAQDQSSAPAGSRNTLNSKMEGSEKLGTYGHLEKTSRIDDSGLGFWPFNEELADGSSRRFEQVLTCEWDEKYEKWYALSLDRSLGFEQAVSWDPNEMAESSRWITSLSGFDYQRQNLLGPYSCEEVIDSIFSQSLRGFSTGSFGDQDNTTDYDLYDPGFYTVFEASMLLTNISSTRPPTADTTTSGPLPGQKMELTFDLSEHRPLAVTERLVPKPLDEIQ